VYGHRLFLLFTISAREAAALQRQPACGWALWPDRTYAAAAASDPLLVHAAVRTPSETGAVKSAAVTRPNNQPLPGRNVFGDPINAGGARLGTARASHARARERPRTITCPAGRLLVDPSPATSSFGGGRIGLVANRRCSR